MSRFARTVLAGFISAFLSQAAVATMNQTPNLPVPFIPNRGQMEARVQYYARTAGAAFWFAREEAVVSLLKDGRRADLTLRFIDAAPNVAMRGSNPMEGRLNYLIGNDRSRWQTDLPMYREIVYGNLWPGIDLAFRDERGTLKYEFRVAAGADYSKIQLQYRGAEHVARGSRGELVVTTALGAITDAKPVSFQTRRGKRVQIATEYVVSEDGRYGFKLARHAANQALVIDPGLAYSTFLGGSDEDFVAGVAVDGSGQAYVAGHSISPNFPGAPLGVMSGFSAFVTKLNPTGTAIVYSTLLGGSGDDSSAAVTVDASGRAYLVGTTCSANFPTVRPTDATLGGICDVFVAILNPAGNGLLYSSYFGGSDDDLALDGAFDVSGDVYVSGLTRSADFPVSPGAFYPGPNPWPAFVTKFSAAGSPVYSTRMPNFGLLFGIAADAAGNAYVAGEGFQGLATTPGAYATTVRGDYDIAVAKLNAAGSQLVYATFIPGSKRTCLECTFLLEEVDRVYDLKVDAAGNAYITGHVTAPDFPSTPGSFDPLRRGRRQGYVTKLNPTGTALVYSTFLGGGTPTIFPAYSGPTGGRIRSIAVDGFGRAFLTGEALAGLTTTTNGFDTTYNGGGEDAFVTVLNPAGSDVEYSSFLGGSTGDIGSAIALDGSGDIYVAGITESLNYPTTVGAYDTSYNGGLEDVFVAKIEPGIMAPFQSFAAESTAGGNKFEVKGTFTLAEGSDGIDPLTEQVTLRVGDTSYVIPPGSFKQNKKRYKFDSKSLDMIIEPLQSRTFEFRADGRGVPAGNTSIVVLTIGNDSGSAASP